MLAKAPVFLGRGMKLLKGDGHLGRVQKGARVSWACLPSGRRLGLLAALKRRLRIPFAASVGTVRLPPHVTGTIAL